MNSIKYEIYDKRISSHDIKLYTESPECFDSVEMQQAIMAAGYGIRFTGTQEEYKNAKKLLHPDVEVSLSDRKKRGCPSNAPNTKEEEPQTNKSTIDDFITPKVKRRAPRKR